MQLSNHQIRVHLLKRTLQFADGNGFQCGIWYEGTLVGVIGLHEINHMHRKTSLGYYLDKQFEGHGIMTQAVEALIKYCFEELDLNRIEISAAVNNEKAELFLKGWDLLEKVCYVTMNY